MKTANFLTERSVAFTLLPHPDTYDAQRLAHVLHVPGGEVAKTVLLRADHGFRYAVAVLPATRRIDLHAAAQALGAGRAELATEVEIGEHCPDCEFGVLPPFGSQYGMQTLLDVHLLVDDQIVFEGNTHHEAVRMTVADFRKIEQPIEASFTVPA